MKRCFRFFFELGVFCRVECLVIRLNLLNFKEKLQNILLYGKSFFEKGCYVDMWICNGKDLFIYSNMLVQMEVDMWICCGEDLFIYF